MPSAHCTLRKKHNSKQQGVKPRRSANGNPHNINLPPLLVDGFHA
jgi:hypothetical protein